MTSIFLLADDADPIGNATESLLNKAGSVRRVSLNELSTLDLDSSSVLLVDEAMANEIDFDNFASSGLVQFLGCRPPSSLLNHATPSDAVFSGISPNVSTRVANRVIGFTGPLSVKPRPKWGLVGLGEVGSEVARKLIATGNSVNIADIRTPRAGLLSELDVRRSSLDLLLSRSDVVSIHAHQGPTAAPLISERELGLMSTQAVLINTSHSSIVDESAVLDALRQDQIAGYATDCPGDVLSNADVALVEAGKLIVTTNPLTNQIGAAQQIAKFIAANMESFAAGARVRGVFQPVDFPAAGDPSFWSSRMSPRQD